jgi:tRNA threonylcarbamoyladenosine biosynthesis protein TsaE
MATGRARGSPRQRRGTAISANLTSSESDLELVLADSSATEAFGAALARAFPGAADGFAAAYLSGELGAGKTTCVRSFLRTLGVAGSIRSPTYSLIEAYRLAALTCVHVDLYRLQGPLEVHELGLRDFLSANCLLLVEWPEKGRGSLPAADLELALTYAGAGRRARLRSGSSRGAQWMSNLRHDASLTSYVSNLT